MERISLNDYAAVQERANAYLYQCSKEDQLPTLKGLAIEGFGMSRQSVYRYLKRHPDTESAEYIKILCCMFDDLLVNESLKNRFDANQAIFRLRNRYEQR